MLGSLPECGRVCPAHPWADASMSTCPHDGMWYHPHVGGLGMRASVRAGRSWTEQGREAERTRADALRQVRGSDVETEWGCLTLERMRSPYTRLAWAPRREGRQMG